MGKKPKFSDNRLALLRARLDTLSTDTGIQAYGSNPTNANVILLSYGQERLWFLHQLNPKSGAYNRPCHFRFTGLLDTSALEKSINEIVKRHGALRTRFVMTEDQPFQLVDPYQYFELPVVDLGQLCTEYEREQKAISLAIEETLSPFDLARGPIMRCKLLRIGSQDHRLLLTVHHIVFDGWSEGLLRNELTTLYEAFLSCGKASSLIKPSVQYTDFSLWQRHALTDERLKHDIAHWKKHLSNQTLVLDLPTDHPRPSVQTSRGKRHVFWIDNALTQKLKSLAQQENTTLFMALMTVFKILLYRYSGQDRIIVGSPLSGRHRPELENLIGLFANILPFLTDLSGQPGFREQLQRVRDTCLEVYKHQELPFEKLVSLLDVERDLSRLPIAQIFFQLRNYPDQRANISNLHAEPWEVDRGQEQFDLYLDAQEGSDGLRLVLRYNTDLFEDPTIVRMAGHYKNLVKEILAAPEQPITSLSFLSREECNQLMVEWNNTTAYYQSDTCIGTLFEHQVGNTPHAIAITFGDQKLTYKDLNERANQLAHYLRRIGVSAESPVGIHMNRTVEQVVAILGVTKAGGAYVPLDADYPEERICFMLQDSGAQILITQAYLKELISGYKGSVVVLEGDWGQIENESSDNLSPVTGSDGVAYIVYTSGSTGTPKGVMGLHCGAINRFAWMWRTYPFGEKEVCCVKTRISFLDSLWEIFGPLLQGVPVVLIPDEVVQDPVRLVESLSSNRVTRLVLVPSLLRALLESVSNLDQRLPDLSLWVTSGESLSDELYRKFREALPHRRLLNLYGSSEVSADVTACELTLDKSRDRVSIGRPIDNTQIYILDQHQNLSPIGVPGELYVGGIGLARGYFNRADLTAERFVGNPFDENSESRLFRTGDRARYWADGEIEYLGRVDDQIKIRGFRIEPAEVETVLREHPMVRDSIVLANENSNLIAYVVALQDTELAYQDSSHWEELKDERVSEWENIWDETFLSGQKQVHDLTTNTAGVISSYTGDPIPEVEIRDWVEHAAKRIRSLKPDRILDVGCGLGRILFRVAPHCSKYWGMDLSKSALDYVQTNLHLLGEHRSKVKLFKGSAEDIKSLSGPQFDTILLNSVVQYFPSLEYLHDVLDSAISRVESGGCIFLGDIRSLPLLDAFHFSVIVSKASGDTTQNELRQSIIRNVMQEKELLVDPLFFYSLKKKFKRVSHVDILLKRGRYLNELTRFRYDVVLHIESDVASESDDSWIDWQDNKLTLLDVCERLQQGVGTLGIRNIPNSRTLPELIITTEIRQSRGTDNAKGLSTMLDDIRASAIHPEEFWAVAEGSLYDVHITWSQSNGPGYFDVFFWRISGSGKPICPSLDFASIKGLKRKGSTTFLVNNPLKRRLSDLLNPSLKRFLEDKLPYYMIPSAFILLDALPLTASGKVDRRTLVSQNPILHGKDVFLPPRNELEKILAQIWQEVLRIEKIGVDDDFFDLGGHSLSATQVTSRIKKLLNTDIALTTIFECPTIGQLATVLQRQE